MAKINILPPRLAELIAAGEVVDRPASIVKELVENSLDAGAKRISVELRRGGISYIRVTDDGCGIETDEVVSAFIRHATSKISDASDLEAIGTLGFRGEALPSIAAVSRVTLTTRTVNSPSGCRCRIDGSGTPVTEECGCAVGTTVEVRDLFYNTPARMKFLKKDVTESNAVSSLIDRLALANPHVSFELIRDGQRKLSTPGDGDLLTAIRVVCGAQEASQMIPVSLSSGGIKVSGYISRPSVCRHTRTMQIFFINSRYVHSKTCAGALEESYKNRLMSGRFPACMLNLSIDTSLVDVNVHPAKLEVRFSSEREVYNAVYAACVAALEQSERRPVMPPAQKMTPFSLQDFDHSDEQLRIKARAPEMPLVLKDATSAAIPLPSGLSAVSDAPPRTVGFSRAGWKPDIERDESDPISQAKNSASVRTAVILPKKRDDKDENKDVKLNNVIDGLDNKNADSSLSMPEITLPPQPPEQEVESFEVLGELFETYILVEQKGNFHLIDKHAAHERYLYETIRHLGNTGEGDRQLLLTPAAVELSRDEYAMLTEHPEALSALGIVAEEFGDRTLLVREIPMLLDGCDLTALLSEAAASLLKNRKDITPSVIDELLYSVSCRAAVMAGKRSSFPEIAMLAGLVLSENGIRHCPHGRPVLVSLSRREVEKMFGRQG